MLTKQALRSKDVLPLLESNEADGEELFCFVTFDGIGANRAISRIVFCFLRNRSFRLKISRSLFADQIFLCCIKVFFQSGMFMDGMIFGENMSSHSINWYDFVGYMVDLELFGAECSMITDSQLLL